MPSSFYVMIAVMILYQCCILLMCFVSAAIYMILLLFHRQVLDQSNKRPTSVLDNERYQTYSVWIEKRLLITIFVSLSLNILM